VFEAASGQRVKQLKSNPQYSEVAVSSDGKWIASGCWKNNGLPNSFTGVWSLDQSAPIVKLPSGNAEVYFTPDAKRLVVAGIRDYTEYECGTWKTTRTWSRQSAGLTGGGVAWSPSDNLLVLEADEYTLRLLDATTNEELARLTTPVLRKLGSLAFSPDGRWLAVLSASNSPQVWDFQKLRAKLKELGLDWR
jgi:WD40 repeat protein